MTDGATRRVLKKGNVRMAETRALIGDPERAGPRAQEPHARVVQQGDGGAVIEVTCSCGRRTQVQCDYAPDAGPD